MFVEIDGWTLILKIVKEEAFFMKPKVQYHFFLGGEWICGAQSLEERTLLCEFVFILIKRRTLILKIVEREVFLKKPKHQYHLSEWRECVYGA